MALTRPEFADSALLQGSDAEAADTAEGEMEQADMFNALKSATGAEGIAILSELLHAMGYRRPAGDE